MKKVLFLIFLVCFASMVFAKRTKKAPQCLLIFESESEWVYEDSLVKITYDFIDHRRDFSCRMPYVCVKVSNKTAHMVYLDLGSSFFIRNDDPEPYYFPGQTVSTSGSSHGGSVNLGSVAGALGVGGVVEGLANGMNVGGGRSSSTSNVTFNQRILTIPPQSAKELEPKPLIRYSYDSYHKYYGGLFTCYNFGTKKNPDPEMYINKYIIGKMEEGEIREIPNEDHSIQVNMYISYSQNEDLSNLKSIMYKSECKSVIGITADLFRVRTPIAEYLNNKKYKTIVLGFD